MASSAEPPGQVGSFASYVIVTKAPSTLRLHGSLLLSLRIHWRVFSIQISCKENASRILPGRFLWHCFSFSFFFLIGLEVLHVISTYIPQIEIQHYDL